MANIEERVEQLIENDVLNLGYELYDVQYIKEGQNYFLRLFIEKQNGQIDLEDCEKVSNGINEVLDSADYIKEQYFLEVSSTGVEKTLRKEKHLKDNIGEKIEIRLFKPINLLENIVIDKKDKVHNKDKKQSLKELIGILENFDKDFIYLKTTQNENIKIDRKDIANMKTIFDWDKI